MARYRYQRGDRPLDGFTIEYGLGVGGFGEVYYAVSDSGREVALKAVQNYEEIELRGIRHCMNLKSPHLVTIFDVRHNDRRDPFVVMEYVRGPSLRTLLNDAPQGLGTTKAAFFLREIAKGLTYLHDSGVVHRDLKPHNVFYEEGFVKIGDYSLCKLISTTHHTGHTMTVGTVHYMAPEVSQGRYDSSVDIYALGVILYEMLTGTPPFTGDSIGEVLMKHMTAEPDVSMLEEPFRSVVSKGLAKQPAQRFQSPEEMVEAVFGTDHVQNSVVAFNPQELTLVAESAAKKVLLGAVPAVDPPHHPRPWLAEERAGKDAIDASSNDEELAEYLTKTSKRLRRNVQTASSMLGWDPLAEDRLSRDPMPLPIRVFLACGVALVLGGLIGSMQANRFSFDHPGHIMTWMWSLAGTFLVCFALLQSKVLRHLQPDARLLPSLLTDLMLVLLVLPLGMGLVPLLLGLRPGTDWDRGADTLLIALVPFGVLNWHRVTHPLRAQRLNFKHVLIAVGLVSLISIFAIRLHFRVNLPTIAALTAMMAMGVQILSPLRRLSSQPVAAANTASQLSELPPTVPGSSVLPQQGSVAVRRESVVVPADASPYARWPLTALAGVYFFMPLLGGLHRFYVGKRSSGFVWLFTLGLGGIGQIVDLIQILRGEFLDAEGRRVLAWETSQAPATRVNKLSSVPPQGHATTALRNVTTVLGSVLFTAAGVLAAVSLGIRIIAGPSGNSMIETAFTLAVIGFGVIIASLGLMFHARAEDGNWARLRVFSASVLVGLVLTFVLTAEILPQLLLVLIFLPIAMVLFAWPARSTSRPQAERQVAEEEVLI